MQTNKYSQNIFLKTAKIINNKTTKTTKTHFNMIKTIILKIYKVVGVI